MDPLSMMTQFSPDSGPASLAALGYKLIVEPIPHRRYREAMFHLAELHQRQRTHGRGGGVLLTGPSGSGKSTILRNYHAAFPRVHEAHRTCVPVLYVPVPSSPTVRSLAAAILEALGDRNSHRGTAPEKTTRIRELFQRCGVEMLLLDEFQHIFYAQSISAFRDATDWIKNLLEDTGIGMVACGLSTAEYVVTSNEQLARRFSQRIRILPFSMEDEQDFLEYRGVLKLLEARLPFGTSLPLYEANVARRVYIGSYGLLDYTIKILEGAVSAANRVGQEEIDLPILCAGFRDRVWRDVPDRLNPFYPDSPLRPLDRPGEIFHQHTRQDAIGSPVANRLGLRLAKGGA